MNCVVNSRCRLRPGFRLCLAGVLALALFTTACSGGTEALESTAACPFGFRDAPVGVQPDDLSCVDLGGFNLAGADFKGDDLSGSYMSGADLSDANLRTPT